MAIQKTLIKIIGLLDPVDFTHSFDEIHDNIERQQYFVPININYKI